MEDAPRERVLAARRDWMVEEQIQRRGVRSAAVLDAMASVPRHRFMPPETWDQAYEDYPVPIGHGQTISQPYIVAAMAELAELRGTERVLDVGTGSGYQAAILHAIGVEVHTIERIEALAERAQAAFRDLGLHGIHCHVGDGAQGLPELAPFDAILVAAAPRAVPQPLIDQLAPDGRLVVPVGDGRRQELLRLRRTPGGVVRESVMAVLFVPLV